MSVNVRGGSSTQADHQPEEEAKEEEEEEVVVSVVFLQLVVTPSCLLCRFQAATPPASGLEPGAEKPGPYDYLGNTDVVTKP